MPSKTFEPKPDIEPIVLEVGGETYVVTSPISQRFLEEAEAALGQGKGPLGGDPAGFLAKVLRLKTNGDFQEVDVKVFAEGFDIGTLAEMVNFVAKSISEQREGKDVNPTEAD